MAEKSPLAFVVIFGSSSTNVSSPISVSDIYGLIVEPGSAVPDISMDDSLVYRTDNLSSTGGSEVESNVTVAVTS